MFYSSPDSHPSPPFQPLVSERRRPSSDGCFLRVPWVGWWCREGRGGLWVKEWTSFVWHWGDGEGGRLGWKGVGVGLSWNCCLFSSVAVFFGIRQFPGEPWLLVFYYIAPSHTRHCRPHAMLSREVPLHAVPELSSHRQCLTQPLQADMFFFSSPCS